MKSFTEIFEGKELDIPAVKRTMLFTDIIGSSKLWATYKEDMYSALLKHDDQIHELVEKYDATILKTIGDAFMICFKGKKSALDALKFAIELTEDLEKKPIKVGSDKVQLRMGFAFGEMYERKVEVQGQSLKDYFGNTVNTASRMESKVSGDGGFAFTNVDKVDSDQSKEMTKLLKEKCKFEVIDFDDDCRFDPEEKVGRSARLLTDLQRHKCENVSKLKGVKPLRAYKCRVKK
jgi:hypothetical protein